MKKEFNLTLQSLTSVYYIGTAKLWETSNFRDKYEHLVKILRLKNNNLHFNLGILLFKHLPNIYWQGKMEVKKRKNFLDFLEKKQVSQDKFC